MNRLILQVFAGILSLWLADRFVSGVEFTGELQYLFLAGLFLGLINFFIKPILKLITLPLRILTLGLFSLVINIAMVWIVDIFFPELIISGIIPLLQTTIIVWAVSLILGLYNPKKRAMLEN